MTTDKVILELKTTIGMLETVLEDIEMAPDGKSPLIPAEVFYQITALATTCNLYNLSWRRPPNSYLDHLKPADYVEQNRRADLIAEIAKTKALPAESSPELDSLLTLYDQSAHSKIDFIKGLKVWYGDDYIGLAAAKQIADILWEVKS